MVLPEDIRDTLKSVAALTEVVDSLGEDDNLFDRGLDSFGSVQLMLALEERYNIEFPDNLLNRRSFSTIRIIVETVSKLTVSAAA
ncbi:MULTISPECIES: acyl carrier protein [Methylobacterium]|jgi:acyl carrier protein|uniref:Aminoacyl carrier protein n=1 Tax=Methylobacterium bullatum TaxID=570505 RepID=A0A679JJI3_9HYPH|nr:MULTISPECIES: acyl carrier protein [Methylobacterium]KQO54594.1 acyl carrier protein [Methylobacterium sp. Leaf85]MBD8904288.1 acyl carrier protein [Methylobacterium bullatum]TXN27299.1 acyl carrier protein [Methylobacterium sp. WL19]CAA2136492.1 Aminoacyl carrier protein [Methylobacterium bullatum]GJD40456.1 Aminoacyl carrier protein [Methylobacterium bullatum]